MIYLACPYKHDDPAVREKRFEAANRAAGKLMLEGHIVFSPLTHNHPIAMVCELPTGWIFWRNFDLHFLAQSEKLTVLRLDGWRHSEGVAAEMTFAREHGIPVEYMDPIL